MARSVAVSADGLNVYVVSRGAIAVFARDTATGALEQLRRTAGCLKPAGRPGGCAVARGIFFATEIEVSEDGANAYSSGESSNAVSVYSRDPDTGALTQLPGEEGCVSNSGSEGCADGRALLRPGGVTAFDANVYLAADGSNAVAVFSRH
jgi:DNA-binding beta-propeller fold protein YncE